MKKQKGSDRQHGGQRLGIKDVWRIDRDTTLYSKKRDITLNSKKK